MGLLKKHVVERFRTENLGMSVLDRWEDSLYYKVRAMRNFDEIRRNGGIIPTIRQLSPTKKAEFVKQANETIRYDMTVYP